MAKKTSSSVSRFANLINDDDQKELDKVYNRTEKNASKASETPKKEDTEPEIEEKASKEDVTEKAEVISEQSKEEIKEERKESGKEEKEQERKEEKKKKSKEEKKKYDVSYKLTREADKAIFILSNSEEFPVRGKNEMVDYIISKFIEKKNVREILDQGIKW